MPRITASVSKVTRTLAESHRHAGVALMPKYAELLGSSSDQSESRGLKTTHRPTPQPSIAGRTRPLMQSFSSSASSRAPVNHVDTMVLPKIYATPSHNEPLPRMPLLPDNYGSYHNSMSDATDLSTGHRPIIFAINPDIVVPGAPLAHMDATNMDSIDVKFVHDQPKISTAAAGEQYNPERSTFMIDMYRSMKEDLLSVAPQLKRN
ncbi:hypothetical protein NXS19_004020 [Fusarium pseudograminearum]|uniref:Uncharacterized protein n=1 Tax=Fusarium pseudograminearum (strain CS3096) TaxID=1028729 RepID=K3VMZ4_FUSPC|nr:hypothetical protein FPSE_03589 [Fusarium pseudograminearum CS3096]EKJ76114.1 hypothetical protein FPSE_03589 [Fusarium pseudograminearum CS3096]KAF0639603.1 hypothetical protein FPSE5266_03589 [Fusarium pseudograminearum]QPC77704.1 hypothetical protein HYE68_008456 [Fusarium pseudograminearum]UZP36204.1 hypothetical protein NXS19_004020 [Fusarium pseudograminearum]